MPTKKRIIVDVKEKDPKKRITIEEYEAEDYPIIPREKTPEAKDLNKIIARAKLEGWI